MEKKSFKCVICGKTFEYSESTGVPPVVMEFKLEPYIEAKNIYIINEKFEVCISCYNQSVFHVNENILEHAKKLIENKIKGI